jgi:hypothetical protein
MARAPICAHGFPVHRAKAVLGERTTKEATIVAAPTHETTERPRTAPSTGNGYSAPTAARGEAKSGKALAGMILGIVSIPAALFAILGLVLGVLAVTLAAVGKGEIRRNGMTNAGQATAGIVLGTIGIVLSIVSGIIGAAAM